jgi:tetraacyldisaccharide 4'-kinase
VVSVGNLTCGGTGKTPVVEMVVRDLLGRGWRPAILSRGYRAAPGEGSAAGALANDEYHVLRENLPGVPHYQGPRRAETAAVAVSDGADVLVLDDGFQHVALRRDLDIVLLDSTRPFGGGRVLPAGLLREPVGALAHADLIAWTRAELVDPEQLDDLGAWLARRFPVLPQLRLRTRPKAWCELNGAALAPGALAGRRVLGFAGVGNPDAFRRQVLALGVEIAGWVAYRDHHAYRAGDVDELRGRARAVEAESLVMTQKDAVKVRGLVAAAVAPGEPPWYYLAIEQEVEAGREEYRRALDRLRRR